MNACVYAMKTRTDPRHRASKPSPLDQMFDLVHPISKARLMMSYASSMSESSKYRLSITTSRYRFDHYVFKPTCLYQSIYPSIPT